MPIYAYKCSSCGHAQDVLQKVSDAPLTVCTACGAPTFAKQLTAAGFQLKGSGWYVTDFKNGGGKKPETKPETTKPETTKPEAPAESKPTDSATPAPAATASPPASGAGGCAACP